jgi:hypothetical protein
MNAFLYLCIFVALLNIYTAFFCSLEVSFARNSLRFLYMYSLCMLIAFEFFRSILYSIDIWILER